MCMDASTLWHVEAAWVLAIHDCKDLAWVLTQEWALSVHAAKTSTWVLTREWALAWDTRVPPFFGDSPTCYTADHERPW